MTLSLIVAVSENGVIGRDGVMPWRLSSDLKLFREVTMGKPVIMGRKTFEAVGRPLPGRTNIVVTRSKGMLPEGVARAASLEAAIELATDTAREDGETEIFVIGGGEIYRLALPLAQRIYRTEVHVDVVGDTWFPDLDPADWIEVSRRFHPAGECDSADFSFVILDRAASNHGNN